MRDLEQFIEAGYSSYDSEADIEDSKSSKKERLIWSFDLLLLSQTLDISNLFLVE